MCLLLRFLESVFWNTHYLRSQPQNDQDLFVGSDGPILTHTHIHSHTKSWWIKLNYLSLIIFWFLRLSVRPMKLPEVLKQSVKDETHTNHVASTNNVNGVHIISSNPDISEIIACAGSSSSKEDGWDTAQTILNILLYRLQQIFILPQKRRVM